MPVGVGLSHDFLLGSKGFMLARGLPGGARAWTRTGQPDSPARRSPEDTKYGNLPDEVDHPEVFNDWSGGMGDAYRSPDRLNTYHWGENVDTRFPGQLIHAQAIQRLDASIYASFNLNIDWIADIPAPTASGQTPMAGGGHVLLTGPGVIGALRPTGLGAAASLFNRQSIFSSGTPVTFGRRPAVFGSYAYVGISGSTTPNTRMIAIRFDSFSISDVSTAGYGLTTAGNRFWRAIPDTYRPFILRSCADPTNAGVGQETSWSATLPVGNGADEIKDIVAYQDQLFAGTPGGLYAGDQSGTFYNVTGDLGQRHEDNCRDLTVFNDEVVAPYVGGLFAFRPSPQQAIRGEVREIGPARPTAGRSPLGGYVRCTTKLGPWLYAGLWTGSQSYVLAGQDRGDGQPFAWHAMQRLPNTAKVHRLHVDGITVSSGGLNPVPNRLWVATDASIPTSGTSSLYFCPIPLNNDNPLAEQVAFSANYAGSARIDFPATNWQAPTTPKIMRAVEVWSENLASGARYADVYYSVDGGTRTLLGRAATSPLSTLYFPTETTGSFVAGQSIALSVESFTASANLTPVYRSFVLRGLLNPRSVDTITAVVRAADGVPNRAGVPDRPGATILADLRAFAGGVPTTLVDTTGATWTVKVLQPVSEQEVYQAGQDTPEIAATVKMVVLSFGP